MSVRDSVIYPSESRRMTALDSEHKGALEISQRPHSLVWVSDEQLTVSEGEMMCTYTGVNVL